MRKTVKVKGFVLRKVSLLNKDTIITLFTRERGKIRCFGKGIKKITSRRLPHMQTGNLVEAVLHQKEQKYYLGESMLISAFSDIKKQSERYRYFYAYLFVVERLLPQDQEEQSVFNLLTHFLIELSQDKSFSSHTLSEYLNDLVFLLGYGDKQISERKVSDLIEGLMNEKIPQVSI